MRPQLRWQLEYDRLFNRVIDNSKLLSVTGLKQSDMMPLYEGLKRELTAEDIKLMKFNTSEFINSKMDKVLRGETL